MIRLPSHVMDDAETHLWVTLELPDLDRQAISAYRELMSADERHREMAFAFEKDRGLYRLSRALMRTALARYIDADPRSLVFSRSPLGRPKIASPSGSALEFSLAHTSGIVVLLVGFERLIGVDVERLHRSPPIEPVMSALGSSEITDLTSRSNRQREQRFLEYWTLKESYAKARGMGLSLSLSRYEFALGHRGIEMTTDPSLDPAPERWSFTLVSPAPQFIAAVAVSRNDRNESLRLEVFPSRPLQD